MNYKVLKEIKKIGGSKKKIEILSNALEEDDGDLESFLRLTYNDDVYGMSTRSIEKIIGAQETVYEDIAEQAAEYYANDDENWEEEPQFSPNKKFLQMLKKKSGQDQLDLYDEVMKSSSSNEILWITRLILRDLRIGLGFKSVNKALKKAGLKKMKKFSVQLAGKFDFVEEYDKGFPCLAAIKYDGFRCVAIKKGDIIELKSRQGKDVSEFLPEIVEELSNIDQDFIVDGEIIADSFSKVQSRIGRKAENVEEIESLQFVLFDILFLNNEKVEQKRLSYRQHILLNFLDNIDSEYIDSEEVHYCKNHDELKEIYQNACDRREEGIIIKLLDKDYKRKSRNRWYKVKPVYDATFELVGIERGTGKYNNTTGAISVKDKNGVITSDVGSGLKDDERDAFWEMKQNGELDSKQIYLDVLFSEITKNKEGEFSLRHPRFDKIRSDKEEADDLTEDAQNIKY